MAGVNDLKQENQIRIKEYLYDGKIWTKNQLAYHTGISLATTTNILQELLKTKEILYLGQGESTGGRKSKEYQLNKDYRHVLKVILKKDLHEDHFIFETVNLLNEILYQKSFTLKKATVNDFLRDVDDILKEDNNVQTIVISLPGVCHQGRVDVCDLEDFENKELISLLKKQTGKEVIVENDVNCASIGFYHQYHHLNCAFIYQPAVDYVGCGMIIEGKLFNGFSHFAGELRYLPFYDHEIQNKLLKENPKELLEKQIATLCCVLNPEAIGFCSDVLKETNLTLKTIPSRHQPQIIQVKQLEDLIKEGLYQIVRKQRIGDKTNE